MSRDLRPLLITFLRELRDSARNDARSATNKLYYTFKRAHDSLQSHSGPVRSVRECGDIKHIGPGIVGRLETKYREFCESLGVDAEACAEAVGPAKENAVATKRRKMVDGTSVAASEASSHTSQSLCVAGKPGPPQEPSNIPIAAGSKQKKPRQRRQYVPQYRSGAYAILIALHHLSSEARPSLDCSITDGRLLTREEITRVAAEYSDTSMDMPQPGKHYTAWSGMRILVERGYVWEKRGAVGRMSGYTLTEAGAEMARRLARVGSTAEDNSANGSAAGSAVGSATGLARAESDAAMESVQSQTSLARPQVEIVDLTMSSTDDDAGADLEDAEPVDVFRDAGRTLSEDIAQNDATGDKEVRPRYFYLSSEGAKIMERNRAMVRIHDGELDYKVLYPPSCLVSCGLIKGSYPQDPADRTGPWIGWLGGSLSEDPCPGIQSVPMPTPQQRITPALSSIFSSPAPVRRSNSLLPSRSYRREVTTVPSTASVWSGASTEDILNRATRMNLSPGTFDIYLVLDNREDFGRRKQPNAIASGGSVANKMQHDLEQHGVRVIRRSLELGDCIWVARRRTGHGPGCAGPDEEIVFDCVVERKTAEDLVMSIRDGRWDEQKSRLERSGLERVIYIVEGWQDAIAQGLGFSVGAMRAALSGLQLVHGFSLKQTRGGAETVAYLARVTRWLEKQYCEKELRGVDGGGEASKGLVRLTYAQIRERLDGSEGVGTSVTLPTFSAFAVENRKFGDLNLGGLFAQFLHQIPGVSAEKAAAITRQFPTMWALREAYRACGGVKEDEQGLVAKQTRAEVVTRRRINAALSAKIWQVVYSGGN